MRKSIAIALFILTFSTVCTILNGVGIFEFMLPDTSTVGLDQATVQDLTNTGTSGMDNILGAIPFIGTILSTLASIIIPVLYLPALLCPFGIPLFIAIALNIPIWFIYGWDIFLIISNRVPD